VITVVTTVLSRATESAGAGLVIVMALSVVTPRFGVTVTVSPGRMAENDVVKRTELLMLGTSTVTVVKATVVISRFSGAGHVKAGAIIKAATRLLRMATMVDKQGQTLLDVQDANK
jgi:hypothetical protein